MKNLSFIKTIVLNSALLFLATLFSHCSKDNTQLLTGPLNIQVLAHRGGAAIKPENSLEAFRYAIAQIGANAIEFDVRQTADQALVINHNPAIDPSICLDSVGQHLSTSPPIYQMTLAQVQSYDCGTLVGLTPGTPLPILTEMLTLVEKLKTPAGAQPNYILHVKWEKNTVDRATYVGLIVAAVAPFNLGNRLFLMSDDSTILISAKAQAPSLPLVYLNPDMALATSLPVNRVAIPGGQIGSETVQKYHQNGILVWAFTVNNLYQWISLVNVGVDGIVTDDPVGLIEVLQNNLTVESPS